MCFNISATMDEKALERRFNAEFAEGERSRSICHVSAFSIPKVPVVVPRGVVFDWAAQGMALERGGLISQYPVNHLECCPISRMITEQREHGNVPQVTEPFEYPELHSRQSRLF